MFFRSVGKYIEQDGRNWATAQLRSLFSWTVEQWRTCKQNCVGQSGKGKRYILSLLLSKLWLLGPFSSNSTALPIACVRAFVCVPSIRYLI